MTPTIPNPYFKSPWPAEDAGAARRELSPMPTMMDLTGTPTVVSRTALVATMVVLREPGEVFLLCHSAGDDAVSWVERIDPLTLETLSRSVDLPGGKTWPGGLAAHANGSLYVVFGRHAHRLDVDLKVLATRKLPRDRPYNSFVLTSDGVIVTKDFGGARPGEDPNTLGDDTELVALDPDDLHELSRCIVPEASIARLSALGSDVYIVGVSCLHRVRWSPREHVLTLDEEFAVAYRREGEGYGWDCVLADGFAWFLNNGQGTERFNGSLRELGMAAGPHSLVRIDLDTSALTRFEIHPGPGGIVANPPAVDSERGIAIGYDSAHGVVAAWNYRDEPARLLWRREINHGSHPIVLSDQGAIVLGDFDLATGREDVVIVDVRDGRELARVATPSPVQSVLFGAVGFDRDLYVCSFFNVSRLAFGR